MAFSSAPLVQSGRHRQRSHVTALAPHPARPGRAHARAGGRGPPVRLRPDRAAVLRPPGRPALPGGDVLLGRAVRGGRGRVRAGGRGALRRELRGPPGQPRALRGLRRRLLFSRGMPPGPVPGRRVREPDRLLGRLRRPPGGPGPLRGLRHPLRRGRGVLRRRLPVRAPEDELRRPLRGYPDRPVPLRELRPGLLGEPALPGRPLRQQLRGRAGAVRPLLRRPRG